MWISIISFIFQVCQVFVPPGHFGDVVYFSYTCVDRGPWGEKMGQRMGGLDVWLVRAAILRICPSWDNASPHTIFKHSGGQ